MPVSTPLLDAACHLAPLPPSLTRLAALVAEEHPDLRDVVSAIELDEVLTARLLRAANGVAYAQQAPVTTVRQAVVLLGTGNVLPLALSAVIRADGSRAVPELGLSEAALWRHSVASALAAELLPRVVACDAPADAFTAALLHDIGKLVFVRVLDPAAVEALLAAGFPDQTKHGRLHTEAAVLGLHHGELGALVADRWGLPQSIVQPVLYHHTPSAFASSHLALGDEGAHIQRNCDMAHVADLVADVVGCELEPSNAGFELDYGACKRLGVTRPALRRLCDLTTGRLEAVFARYAQAAGERSRAA